MLEDYSVQKMQVFYKLYQVKFRSTNTRKFQDEDQMWYGLTKRARILVYNKNKVKPEELSTYEALTERNGKAAS